MSDIKITEADIRAAKGLLNDIMTRKYQKSREVGDFETIVLRDAQSLSEFVIGKESRTYCILVISFLEDTFKRNFIERLKIDTPKKLDEFFGGNGPLSTFAQRITIASGLGWLPSSFRNDAVLLRKVRNEFAHNHNVHLLTEEPMRSWLNNMQSTERVWIDDERPNYRDRYDSAGREVQSKLRVFTTSMHLIAQVLARAKKLEEELPAEYREEGYFGLTGLEQGLIDVMIRHCFASVGLAADGIIAAQSD